ncbi:MAG: hypothetical protein VW618_12295, partial [Alphaproteobacteria bacterium]
CQAAQFARLQTTRAGAFVVLPAHALWPFVAEHFTFRARVRTSALMLGAAVLGFAPGSLANWFFGGDTSEVHSNFSYTLFGIAAGGERWIYALERLPGASSDEIFAAAFELIRTQPLLFLEGLFQGFLEYIGCGVWRRWQFGARTKRAESFSCR